MSLFHSVHLSLSLSLSLCVYIYICVCVWMYYHSVSFFLSIYLSMLLSTYLIKRETETERDRDRERRRERETERAPDNLFLTFKYSNSLQQFLSCFHFSVSVLNKLLSCLNLNASNAVSWDQAFFWDCHTWALTRESPPLRWPCIKSAWWEVG